ncbi:hypothetical protein PInf_012160 [Phytophthora infestans]|nr:hypothetical protein PInf_012160 [Phytophthora infestans]
MRRATRVLVRLRSDHSSTKNCKNTLDEARNTLVITPEYAARLEANMKVRGAELHAVKDSKTANRPVRRGSRGTNLSKLGSSSSSSSLTGLAVATAPALPRNTSDAGPGLIHSGPGSYPQDVVMHLVESGHLLLHQRFRAAFVERWVAAEVIGLSDGDENGIISGRLRALQSCMDLVQLLSYKRELGVDQDDCSVAKMYIEHTVLSMDAGTGADVRGIKQQVAANFESLRIEVASEFYKEYAVHLRTLGFRRLRTLATSRSHARAFPADPSAANEIDIPVKEDFSEYFYHPRALQEAQLFTRELFRVTAQHYERDLL